MTKYSRIHYVEIGELIRKVPKSKRPAEFRKWNKRFKKDNPRYNSKKFKKFVGL